jgi:hypothetical protein
MLDKQKSTEQGLAIRTLESNDLEDAASYIINRVREVGLKERTHIIEDVSAGPGAHQVIVAASGDLISATRVTAGPGATQLIGQMPDELLQMLSQQRGD